MRHPQGPAGGARRTAQVLESRSLAAAAAQMRRSGAL